MELPHRDPDEIELEQRLRNYELRSLRFAYEETNRLIDLQMDQVESLNTKASILLGFIGVIVAALFSAWPVMAEQLPKLGVAAIWLSVLATLTVIVGAFFGFRAYWIQPYEIAPSPRRLWEKYLTWNEEHVRYTVFYKLVQVYEHNGRLIKSKIRSLKLCLGFLLFSFLLLTVVFLWSIINLKGVIYG